jgi:predicted CopG family antitoxin
MEAKDIVVNKDVNEKIQLVKGEYSPSEASYIVMNLIDKKINFHQIRLHQIWEQNHNSNTEDIDKRIKELEKEKEVAKAFISNAIEQGLNIKIDGVLEMSISES